MKGWILYKRNSFELTAEDYGVNRLRQAAATLGIVIEVYKPEQFDVLVTSEASNTLFLDKVPCCVPDFLIPRMGADTTYFALSIIRQLEQRGVYVCNNSAAILTVKDKMHMGQKLMGAGLPTPKTMLVKFPVCVEQVQRELGFPVVIKTLSGAKGFGVHLCESAAGLNDLMELMSMQPCIHEMILQAFVTTSYGRDLRAFVVGDQVVGCMQRTSTRGFKANFSLGGHVQAVPITSEIEHLARMSTRLFGLDIAGVDLLFESDGFTICEANSAPGFKGMEQATGVDIAMQIMNYIQHVVINSTSIVPSK